MTTTTTFQKACDCRGATASGPRVTIREVGQPELRHGVYQFRLTYQWADMACDLCDTPWSGSAPGEGA